MIIICNFLLFTEDEIKHTPEEQEIEQDLIDGKIVALHLENTICTL